jgi:hypothetical protein
MKVNIFALSRSGHVPHRVGGVVKVLPFLADFDARRVSALVDSRCKAP